MLKMRIPSLGPRYKRELRHWAIELVVVIIGVLLALLAAEWAQDRRGKADADRAQAAIEYEILAAGGGTYNFLSVMPCNIAMLDQIEAALTNRTELPATLSEGPGLAFGIVVPLTLARDEAASSGAMGYIDPRQRETYGRIYAYLAEISETTNELNSRRNMFAPLVTGQSLTQAERNAMLIEVQMMRGKLQSIEALSGTLFDWMAELPLDRHREQFGKSRFASVVPELREIYGGCVNPVESDLYAGLIEN